MGEVALEQPGGLASALALGEASGDVVAGSRVVLAAVPARSCAAVELAVAAAAEPMSCRMGMGAAAARRRRGGQTLRSAGGRWAATIVPTPGSSSKALRQRCS
jgi:hypothetical protein